MQQEVIGVLQAGDTGGGSRLSRVSWVDLHLSQHMGPLPAPSAGPLSLPLPSHTVSRPEIASGTVKCRLGSQPSFSSAL